MTINFSDLNYRLNRCISYRYLFDDTPEEKEEKPKKKKGGFFKKMGKKLLVGGAIAASLAGLAFLGKKAAMDNSPRDPRQEALFKFFTKLAEVKKSVGEKIALFDFHKNKFPEEYADDYEKIFYFKYVEPVSDKSRVKIIKALKKIFPDIALKEDPKTDNAHTNTYIYTIPLSKEPMSDTEIENNVKKLKELIKEDTKK